MIEIKGRKVFLDGTYLGIAEREGFGFGWRWRAKGGTAEGWTALRRTAINELRAAPRAPQSAQASPEEVRA